MSTAQELSFTKGSSSGEDYTRYLDKRGIPAVKLKTYCSKNRKICWSVAVDQSGKKIKKFNSNDSVIGRAWGRYDEVAYLLVSRIYTCGKRTCSEELLISSKRNVTTISTLPWQGNTLATRVGKKGELYAVTRDAFISRRSGKRSESLVWPEPMVSARIGFNIDGIISAIMVAESGQLYWSDGKQLKRLNVQLAAHADRMGVSAIYPWNRNTHYIALYRYINEYNKGLYVFRFDSVSGKEEGGWLFNSEDRNIGFDPGIYHNKSNGKIVVMATNSSDKSRSFFRLSEKDFLKMSPKFPEHVRKGGFEEEKLVSFILGGGISQVSWGATSKIEKDDIVYTDIDYLIADSFFKSVHLEGRIGDTSLAISYLQNQSEGLVANEIDSIGNSTSRNLSKVASSYLFSTVDFHGLLSSSSMLRIQTEIGETNGIAKVSHNDGSVVFQDFSTEMNRVAVLSMMERGNFMGVDYIKYTMPSAIGFSDSSKSIVYANFDPKFGFQALRFVGGYDALAYARRYETDYSRFYWTGSGNIGIGWAKISSEIKQDVLASTGATEIDDLPIYVTMGAYLELGYLWQQRFRRFSGLGYSISLGYSGNYSRMKAGQSEDSEPVAGTLYMEFERDDLMHGFFLKANIIF
jgi:hypothetical protein